MRTTQKTIKDKLKDSAVELFAKGTLKIAKATIFYLKLFSDNKFSQFDFAIFD